MSPEQTSEPQSILRVGKEGVYHIWREEVPTSSGIPLRVTRAERLSLSRISDKVLGSVIYLYRSKEEAEEGADPGGTGFLLSVQSEAHPDYMHVYAVTCKHVAQAPGYASFIRITNATRIDRIKGQLPFMAGNREVVSLGWNQWTPHPTADVAIVSLGPDNAIMSEIVGPGYGRRFGFTFPSFLLLHHDVIEGFDVGPGDDVYMCGRFESYPGRYFNEPTTRWGIISLMHTMIELEEGEPPEEVFLIEMRSISGYSGSPVAWRLPIQLDVIQQMERRMTPESGQLKIGPWLVGIDAGNFPFYYPVYEVTRERGGKVVRRKDTKNTEKELQAKSHSGVAYVVPAWKIQELLDREEFVMQRKRDDEAITEHKDSGKRVDRDVILPDDPLTRKTFLDDVLPRVSQKITDSTSEPESEKEKQRP